ncbi:sterol desaturase family protein [Luteimonas salinilitoris]|uniref:Sterol desaturase family protein n=1 Tax=Luteimonas salinilitoris TaxID=3237697 RepID=A0ABV4HSS3_9GAMM
MNAWWLAHAGPTRLLVVGALLLVLLLCQRAWPTRGETPARGRRWRNVGLAAVSTLLVYLILPLTAVTFAWQMTTRGIGLLAVVDMPAMLEFLAALVVLDLAIYWQHRWFHVIPQLWRIHRVHHSDLQFEVTLGLRFHPAEILLSMLYKFAVIAALGPSPVAVAVYEILLAAFALLTHADVAIPHAWDRQLRRVLVTPDWHRVHHSVYRDETDSNYGNILSLWDRLFHSRIEQPRDGHRGMQIGLTQFRAAPEQTLIALLQQPLADDLRLPSNQ